MKVKSKKKITPYCYLFFSIVSFLLLIVYPLLYTFYISLTNLGTGHILNCTEAKKIILEEVIYPDNAAILDFNILEKNNAFILYMKQSERKAYQIFLPRNTQTEEILTGTQISIDEYKKLSSCKNTATSEQFIEHLTHLERTTFQIENRIYKLTSLTTLSEVQKRYKELNTSTIIDTKTNSTYQPDFSTGYFETPSGDRLLPGFVTRIGFQNYLNFFKGTSFGIPFLKIFLWTLMWAAGSTISAFIFGLILASLLSSQTIYGKKIFRVGFLIPYAIPVFLSAMVWSAIFNFSFGPMNKLVSYILHIKIPWLLDPLWAKLACLMVGLWVGFPYMMLICLGLIQSIPQDLYDAAKIDGAGFIHRFTKITFPSLYKPMLPILIGTFAFNFNNFNLIYLFSGGNPPMVDTNTMGGETDLLISYTYKLAFGPSGSNNFGLASAIAVIIFILIASMSIFNFKISGVFKEEESL